MTFTLFIALAALVVAILAVFLARMWAAPRGAAPQPFTIKGSVKVTNDCDGNIASIPNTVEVSTSLANAAGNISVPGKTIVNLVPDPADPNNPVKIGNYTITVLWLGAAIGSAATQWNWPVVRDRFGGTDVCIPIACSAGRCHNMAVGQPVAVAGANTNHNVETVCGCN